MIFKMFLFNVNEFDFINDIKLLKPQKSKLLTFETKLLIYI